MGLEMSQKAVRTVMCLVGPSECKLFSPLQCLVVLVLNIFRFPRAQGRKGAVEAQNSSVAVNCRREACCHFHVKTNRSCVLTVWWVARAALML